jgi:two-component system response regulator WspF
MRIGIVNDLRMAVETLRRIVEATDGLEVAWIAMDGIEAVARTVEDRPDLILMDLVMPEMDGVEATRRIMAETPCPILIVTATVEGNARKVVAALAHGAVDAVQTPIMGLRGDVSGAAPLLERIERVRKDRLGLDATSARSTAARADVLTPTSPAATSAGSRYAGMLLIGASTGGPQAIQKVLQGLPAPFPVPIAVVQHIDPRFVDGLCQWLGETTGHRVVPSAQGPQRAGEVVVASGEHHLVVDRAGYHHDPEPSDVIHRPSVDRLFESAVESGLVPGVAVLLTGMGRDGAEGLGRLRSAGWGTIAQDEASSVVWGMPGSAIRAGAAEDVLPLDLIGGRIATRLGIAGAGT